MDTDNKAVKVLVVDDNRDITNTMSALLKILGYSVEVAYDGKAGVETASTFEPHVVLMDIGMPILNGFEAATLMRARLGQRTRLIAISAHGSPSYREAAKVAGFDEYVQKPANLDCAAKTDCAVC